MWTAFARTHYERLNARYASRQRPGRVAPPFGRGI